MDLTKNIDIMQDFQYAINIGYDLYSDDKIKNYIPTPSAIEIIEDIMLSTSNTTNDRAKIFVGAYGKGKSHLALIIASLLFRKEPGLFSNLLSMICQKTQNSKGESELCTYTKNYLESPKKMLPVIIQGSSIGIRQALMSGLHSALKNANLDHVMPDTYFKSAVMTILNWQKIYTDTFNQFKKLIDCNVKNYISELENFNIDYYENFKEIYPNLTAGSEFNPITNIDVIELYNSVNKSIKKEGYTGIFVIYDEFSKFLEGNLDKTSAAEIKTLQDFAENCCRTKEQQIHILLISHQSILNYVDKLPKNKIDAWKAVSNRFKTLEFNTSLPQQFDLMSKIICQDEKWFKNYQKENEKLFNSILEKWQNSKVFSSLNDKDIRNIVFGCYPLQSITTFLLPNISEKIAQNERTIFTFLSSRNQKNTLYAFLKDNNLEFPLLTPDYIFDYFEPLFKTENYTKATHKYWKNAYVAINKLSKEEWLEKKIIKTIALIYIYDHFELLSPTVDMIFAIYENTVKDTKILSQALTNLIDKGILRQLENRNQLRITEHTDVNVEAKINDAIEKRKNNVEIKDILNDFVGNKVLYPNAYNDNNEVVRFFRFKFINQEDLNGIENWEQVIKSDGADGIVYAVIPKVSADKKILFKEAYKNVNNDRILFVVPKARFNINEQIIKYDAIKYLIEHTDDEILSEELSYSLNALSDVISDFVDIYLKPELNQSKYYSNGKEEHISRRSALSKKLSEICEKTYSDYPIINNEVLNKNILSSQAINSRSKVVAGLLESNLKENLGLIASGQDVSFMRSTVKNEGIFVENSGNFYVNIENLQNKNLQNVINIIKSFILKSAEKQLCFSELYMQLTEAQYHIGMKLGLIPIYLACVLHHYKKYAVILKNNKEVEINAKLLDSINEEPENFYIALEEWDSTKEDYILNLKNTFAEYVHEDETEYNNFEFVVRAMQRWFFQLPKYTKEMTSEYASKDKYKPLDKKVLKFKNALKAPEINAREFLFNKLPEIFGYKGFSTYLEKDIISTKEYLDNIKGNLIKTLADEMKIMFATDNLNNKASLSSVMRDWVEQFNKDVLTHAFSSSEEQMLKLCSNPSADAIQFIELFARTNTGLRIDDWDNITIDSYNITIKKFKDNIEFYNDSLSSNSDIKEFYKISYTDASGIESFKTFKKMEYSSQAKLLYNDAEAMMQEYGESLTAEEKRQVLVDIIQKVLI